MIILENIFGNNPIDWMKWGFVFSALVGGYMLSIWLSKKVLYYISWERKAEIAKERNHVIEAKLIKDTSSYHVEDDYDCSGIYQYTWDGEVKKHRVRFKTLSRPPYTLHLYYLDSPIKLFHPKEEHWDFLKGALDIFFIILPWIIAVSMFWLLGLNK